MSESLYPTGSVELREMLRSAASAHRSIQLRGANSKRLMGGPIAAADVHISTTGMKRILQYEPRDLTISVDAGIRYAELSRELARQGQMIPLAGPYSPDATIGGIVAANSSESRRRGYGTARDLVIGMEFITLEGKSVQSGGMVVKNVAGLDMGKLMIGSFGTLAAIATVNFRLLPIPPLSRTLIIQFEDLKSTLAANEAIVKAGLHPVASDILNPILATQFQVQFGLKGFVLAVQFGGNEAVIARCTREATAIGSVSGSVRTLSPELSRDDEQRFWAGVAQLIPRHLEKFQDGVVARITTPLAECGIALATLDGAGHAMVGNGIVRAYFSRSDAGARWLNAAVKRGWKGVLEFAGSAVDKNNVKLWPEPGGEFEIMRKVKTMFDPDQLLNRGRLYGLL